MDARRLDELKKNTNSLTVNLFYSFITITNIATLGRFDKLNRDRAKYRVFTVKSKQEDWAILKGLQIFTYET